MRRMEATIPTRPGSRLRDGVRIAYEEAGRGDPPLVFVHGWCCNRSHFAPQVRYFAARHRVLAVDQRGFGDSDGPAQDYSVEALADDLAWLCAELALDRPVLVGHSLGGAVALAVAARRPDLPRALALCDPAIVPTPRAAELRRKLATELASARWRDAAFEFIDRFLFGEGFDPEHRARIAAEMCETPQHVMHSSFASLCDFDSEAAARRCRVPTLVVEAAIPILDRERLRELCPGARFERTPDAGHFHQLEAPDAVNAILERFFASLR
jgi:pimeloyl-ACP methyl ester carboxylesterase